MFSGSPAIVRPICRFRPFFHHMLILHIIYVLDPRQYLCLHLLFIRNSGLSPSCLVAHRMSQTQRLMTSNARLLGNENAFGGSSLAKDSSKPAAASQRLPLGVLTNTNVNKPVLTQQLKAKVNIIYSSRIYVISSTGHSYPSMMVGMVCLTDRSHGLPL